MKQEQTTTRTITVNINGTKTKMTYEAICQDLGFIADVKFVKVTTAGSISFTCGKKSEVRALLSAVRSKGYSASRQLIQASSQY